MASSSNLQIFLFIFTSLIVTFSRAQIAKSNPFVVPITKDASTLQYLATIHYGNPLSPASLVLDLNGPFAWMDCRSAPRSSPSRQIVPRGSIECSAAKSKSKSKSNSRCAVSLENEIGRVGGLGDLVEDVLAVDSVDRSTEKFLYGCAETRSVLLKGLASGAQGMLGLGRAGISLPSQVSSLKGLNHQFTTCLSSSNGVVLVHDGYLSLSSYFGSELSKSMVYTPLLSLTGREESTQQQDYFVNLKSINIGGKKLSLDIETTKLSTLVPYNTMKSSIYAVFAEGYLTAALSMNMTRVGSVAPFGLCFGSEEPIGPEIDLVLQSELVKWRLSGRNSLVRVGEKVVCLGFLESGDLELEASIVLGGYQLEDTVLHFDVTNSMLGFSPLLKWKRLVLTLI